MKVWVGFIVGSFILGVLLWKAPDSRRAKVGAGLALAVCVAYLMLNMI
jgi:hypothetical protein